MLIWIIGRKYAVSSIASVLDYNSSDCPFG